MANDCLVTKFKGVVNNDMLPYFDKGVIYCDNTGITIQNRNNSVRLSGEPSFTLDSFQSPDGIIIGFNTTVNRLVFEPDNPANTKGVILYPLYDVTGINDSENTENVSVLKFRMLDLKRMVKLQRAEFHVMELQDENYNFEELHHCPQLGFISLSTKFYGDIVSYLNSRFSKYGYPTEDTLTRIAGNGVIKLNGTATNNSKYYHCVANSGGYKIYMLDTANVQSDYSVLTPIYEKTV